MLKNLFERIHHDKVAALENRLQRARDDLQEIADDSLSATDGLTEAIESLGLQLGRARVVHANAVVMGQKSDTAR